MQHLAGAEEVSGTRNTPLIYQKSVPTSKPFPGPSQSSSPGQSAQEHTLQLLCMCLRLQGNQARVLEGEEEQILDMRARFVHSNI